MTLEMGIIIVWVAVTVGIIVYGLLKGRNYKNWEVKMGRRVKWLNVADLTEVELASEHFVGLTPEQVREYLLSLAKAQKGT